MKKSIRYVLALIMVFALLLMAACADPAPGGNAASTVPDAGGAAPASTDGAGTAPAAGGQVKDITSADLKIAYVAHDLGTETNTLWGQGIAQALEIYPNVAYKDFDSKSSADEQNRIMEELIVQEYDAIILHASDSDALVTAVDKAEANGINVITLNIVVNTNYSGKVGMVNRESGVAAAHFFGEQLGGEGKICMILPPVGLLSVIKSPDGLRETLAEEYPGIEVLEEQSGDWTTESGNNITRDYLTKYGDDIDAIWCMNDGMAVGCVNALEGAGKAGEILVTGSDGDAQALEYIRQGKMHFTGATDRVEMGRTAARLAMFSIGTGVSGAGLTEFGAPTITIPPLYITQENVEVYIASKG